jgi:enoyl-CoA hydratase/carnithine racemase
VTSGRRSGRASGGGHDGAVTEPEPVLVRELRGNVLVLRLNRPEARNALSPELLGLLGAALEEAESDTEIRCVVITGTGDRAFCAGMDLRAFSEGVGYTDEQRRGLETFGRFCRSSVDVPVVGAANATAVGGGFEILLGCDVVVASAGARFGLPEVKRGLYPAGGGFVLTTRIPMAQAMEMLLTGDLVEADRALDLGLVNQVVPYEEVLDAAVAMAERIAANGPLAVAAVKRLGRASLASLDEAWTLHQETQPEIFGSADAAEGAAAFIEKRDPNWTGT